MDPAVLTVISVVGAALIGAVFPWLNARAKAKADLGDRITTGFAALTDQLQEERITLLGQLNAERLQATTALHELMMKNETAQLRIRHLEGEYQRMAWHAGRLEQAMFDAGLNPPIMKLGG